jgi:ABC-type sulfate transport system substrate-binding protein
MGYGSINDQTIARLKSYLLQKNITTVSIKRQSAGEANTCDACTCPKGFKFDVVVFNQYTDSLAREGFTLKY